MSGRIEFFNYAIAALSGVSALTDLWRGRIFNWITFPAMLAGLIASVVSGGWQGFLGSFLGILVGFLLYGWMFWFRAMGGGDVKLLMALGAWGGVRYVAEVGVLGVVLGGVMAIAMLAFRGKIVSFGKRLYRFLMTVFVKELEAEPMKIDRSHTMPFGVPIALAAVWVAFDSPYLKWGIQLWK